MPTTSRELSRAAVIVVVADSSLFPLCPAFSKPVAPSADAAALKSIAETQDKIIEMLNKRRESAFNMTFAGIQAKWATFAVVSVVVNHCVVAAALGRTCC